MRISLPVIANGAVFYDGPSRIDGTPVLGVAVGLARQSENTKTGGLVQTVILRKDRPPTQAIRDGADASVCGPCAHRGEGGKHGSCYVNVSHMPDQTWKCVQNGTYKPMEPELIARQFPGRKWRLGSYGNPSAIPVEVWEKLLDGASGVIGYDARWKEREVQPFRRLLMASAMTEAQALAAQDKGWRTYRTKLAGERALPNEIVCPASLEGQYRRTCEQCMACDGSRPRPSGAPDRRVNIVINAHGLSWKIDRFRAAREKVLRSERRRRVKS